MERVDTLPRRPGTRLDRHARHSTDGVALSSSLDIDATLRAEDVAYPDRGLAPAGGILAAVGAGAAIWLVVLLAIELGFPG